MQTIYGSLILYTAVLFDADSSVLRATAGTAIARIAILSVRPSVHHTGGSGKNGASDGGGENVMKSKQTSTNCSVLQQTTRLLYCTVIVATVFTGLYHCYH